MAMPAASAAAITSGSRRDPPGWIAAVVPALCGKRPTRRKNLNGTIAGLAFPPIYPLEPVAHLLLA